MLEQAQVQSPVEMLKRGVVQAFPNRQDVEAVRFDGSYAQAWQTFARMLGIDDAELARVLAPLFKLELAPRLDSIESGALVLVPFAFCQSQGILPLKVEQRTLVVATANPFASDMAERLAFMTSRPIRWVLAAPEPLADAIAAAFHKEAAADARVGDGASVLDENAVVNLGRGLLVKAIAQRASDLHIQPYLGAAVVRLRIDGELRRLSMLPDALAVTLVRHFKAKCGMDPTNNMIPQDGRMGMVCEGRDYDMRVSVLPTARGERLVMRFLDQTKVHHLTGAGFSLAALQTLRRSISRPSGMVILTGPTGSGKTSTLYAMLAELNKGSVNIITVENPVEYRIPGISQVEVNDKAGRTFAAALRSILRQDPDIVLIGEIRDQETAEIAVQAAMTGHLVLTTLHTNDALSAIPRLLGLGVQPSMLADSLAAVAAQRLCRTLCLDCRVLVVQPYTPEENLFLQVTRNAPAYRAVGCKHCDYTGYKGRLPIVDIVEVTPRLRDAIAVGESRLAALSEVREGGLKSLAASGGLRVISGDTTVSEVMNAVGPGFWMELSRHFGAICPNDLDLGTQRVVQGAGVLLMSEDATLAEHLRSILEAESMRLQFATSREMALQILKQDELITYIVGDLPEGMKAEVAAVALRKNRRDIAWARLPSAVLLPASLADQEDYLRTSGVMADFLPKPLDPAKLLGLIRSSQAR
jgi:type II secretory ATPase GspE/PulE/Tfp pilus assembly ATPase PilB-like protein/CheY-like chemotaxis protein